MTNSIDIEDRTDSGETSELSPAFRRAVVFLLAPLGIIPGDIAGEQIGLYIAEQQQKKYLPENRTSEYYNPFDDFANFVYKPVRNTALGRGLGGVMGLAGAALLLNAGLKRSRAFMPRRDFIRRRR